VGKDPKEVEIKFRIDNVPALNRRLRSAGFQLQTPRTHEMNTLYDLAGQQLRKHGALLRLRQYGSQWILTHKAKAVSKRHKSRVELETRVEDGRKMHAILTALGFRPSFTYEKFRAEWTDGTGHVVVDETPIGNIGEIEGPPPWIDRTAKRLAITPAQYITKSYAELFMDWKKANEHPAHEMTFRAVAEL
jgi:adenylate cyclase, class 2